MHEFIVNKSLIRDQFVKSNRAKNKDFNNKFLVAKHLYLRAIVSLAYNNVK